MPDFDRNKARFEITLTLKGHYQVRFKRWAKDRGTIVAQLPKLAAENLDDMRWLVSCAAMAQGVDVYDYVDDSNEPLVTSLAAQRQIMDQVDEVISA